MSFLKVFNPMDDVQLCLLLRITIPSQHEDSPSQSFTEPRLLKSISQGMCTKQSLRHRASPEDQLYPSRMERIWSMCKSVWIKLSSQPEWASKETREGGHQDTSDFDGYSLQWLRWEIICIPPPKKKMHESLWGNKSSFLVLFELHIYCSWV